MKKKKLNCKNLQIMSDVNIAVYMREIKFNAVKSLLDVKMLDVSLAILQKYSLLTTPFLLSKNQFSTNCGGGMFALW